MYVATPQAPIGGRANERAVGEVVVLRGRIAKVVREKGFGFITPGLGGEDVFFHCLDTNGEFEDLMESDPVLYSVAPDGRKRDRSRAINVRPDY